MVRTIREGLSQHRDTIINNTMCYNYEKIPVDRFYTHVQLRVIVKERKVTLGTNISKQMMCEKLGIKYVRRNPHIQKYDTAPRPIILTNVDNEERVLISSTYRAAKTFELRGSTSIAYRIKKGKFVTLVRDTVIHNGEVCVIRKGTYRIEYKLPKTPTINETELLFLRERL